MGVTVGQVLGSYRIDAHLGRGGMGEVFAAYDARLDRTVALKVLLLEVADPECLERFEREARAIAALDHPNIVTLFSIEAAAGVRFLTMEYVDGKTLSEWIPKGGLDLERFFATAVPLTDAVAAAHGRGIVHRDLKPGNVMLNRDGRLKVLDFGLAKLVAPTDERWSLAVARTATLESDAGVVVGTVGYMAPEQVRGEAADQRSDVFALGVVLYELAVGKRPFEAESTPEVLSAILRDSPPPVDEVRDELPHHLARIIRRCLEKDPARRYPSAREVCSELVDLARELETRSVLAAHAPRAAATGAAGRRRWGIAAAALAAALAVAWIAFEVGGRGSNSPVAGAGGTIRSLAVLPFDNLMGDPDQDYFVDGMHEALITDLSKIGNLRVISRTSAMRYRDSTKSLPEIARELAVDALIEGSVLRADGQVRITAQLIDGQADEHLWADSYDRELEDVLALLSEVAQAIAREIEVTVTPGQRLRLTTTQTVDPQAQELYWRGQHYFNQGGVDGFREALGFHRQAVERDADFAAGWAGLAGSYLVHGFFNLAPAAEMIPKARAAARRAIELDESQAPAHSTLGYIALFFDWDWPTARRELELAIELDPTDAMALHAYADYLAVVGDCNGSVDQVRLGRRYDPMGGWANAFLVGHLTYCGRYQEAIQEGREAVRLGVETPEIRDSVGLALWQLGRHEEALTEWREASGANDAALQELARGYAEGGPRGGMLARAEGLAAAAESSPVNPFWVAAYYAAAEQADAAFLWLDEAFQQRTPQLLHLTIHPRFDPIRADPRFADLLRRIGIPDAAGARRGTAEATDRRPTG